MLTKLSLKNVKSFDNESNLNLAPITLIYGPNSSGKSTLWKFLVTLRDSLSFKGYGQSFLNFNRSDDFANARTISFDPKEASSFGLGFFGGRKIYHDDLSKWLNKNPEKIKFKFDFINTETIDGFSDRYTDTISDLRKLIDENKELGREEKTKLEKNIDQLLKATKPVKEVENYLSEKFKDKDDKGVILVEFKIYKEDKCFATYAIHQIDNINPYDVNRTMGRYYLFGE